MSPRPSSRPAAIVAENKREGVKRTADGVRIVGGVPLHLKPEQSTAKQYNRINLRAVGDVLSQSGLDPTVELVKILESGKLPADIQARILNELLQYTQPKLKSIEIRAKVAATAFDVNDEQARRIAEEFLRATT